MPARLVFHTVTLLTGMHITTLIVSKGRTKDEILDPISNSSEFRLVAIGAVRCCLVCFMADELTLRAWGAILDDFVTNSHVFRAS